MSRKVNGSPVGQRRGREAVEVDPDPGSSRACVRIDDPRGDEQGRGRRHSGRTPSPSGEAPGGRAPVAMPRDQPLLDERRAEPGDIVDRRDAEQPRGQRAIDVGLDREAEERRRADRAQQARVAQQQRGIVDRRDRRAAKFERHETRRPARSSALAVRVARARSRRRESPRSISAAMMLPRKLTRFHDAVGGDDDRLRDPARAEADQRSRLRRRLRRRLHVDQPTSCRAHHAVACYDSPLVHRCQEQQFSFNAIGN